MSRKKKKPEIKVNSIITLEDSFTIQDLHGETNTTYIKVISIVDKIVDNELYCRHSITMINGDDPQHTKDINPGYEGEILTDMIRLVDSDDFDVVIDSNLIPRSAIKNPK